MAAPLTAAMTGWCSRRRVSTMSSSSSIERSAYVGRVRPSTCGGVPGRLLVGARAEAVAGAGEDDGSDGVVVAELHQRVAERDHHVERHRVHPLRPVQGDDGDLGDGPVDQDEGHAVRVVVAGCRRGTAQWRHGPRRPRARPGGVHPSCSPRSEPDDWSRPTPCDAVGRRRRRTPPHRRRPRVHDLAGRQPYDLPAITAEVADRRHRRPRRRRTTPPVARASRRVRERDADGPFPTGFGPMPVAAIAELRTIEALTHGWDVARGDRAPARRRRRRRPSGRSPTAWR